jgi:hypothetical protein
MEMGRLPALPSNCIPVWQDWNEVGLARSKAEEISQQN